MPPKTRSLAQYRGDQCLNCGTPLDKVDKYCHQCGQLNSTKQLALKDFFSEFVSNIFSYDSRGWRTIKHILFKPGYVSKEFINGRRMSYANPFRFFLSVCIVFFLFIQLENAYQKYYGNRSIQDGLINTGYDEPDEANANDSLINQDKEIKIGIGNQDFEIQDDQNELEGLTEKELAQIESKPGGKFIAKKIREERDAELARQRNDTTSTKKKERTYATQEELDEMGWFKRLFEQISDYKSFYDREEIVDPEKALTKLGHRVDTYNIALYERGKLLDRIESDPSLLVEVILPKLPIFLFLFTPFVTLFLWLLYIRRSFTFMEHLIFSFNVLTFVFLSGFIIILLNLATFGWLDLSSIFFFLIGPFYLYKSLRNFYGQSRIKTIIKFLLINFVYAFAFSIGFVLLLFIGIAIS